MLKIYACGGTGANIGKMLVRDPNLDVSYIDTSSSNLKNVDMGTTYLIEDKDGAGGNRSITYDVFTKVANDVIIRFKPSASLNLVISSLGGGSGSVIAPLVTKSLLQNNLPTMVLAIESLESLRSIDNCINTLLSYKKISSDTNKTVTIRYTANDKRSDADSEILQFINLMCVITDKSVVEEFDTADISSFLNFDTVTSNKPTVGMVKVSYNEDAIAYEKNTFPAASILVTTDTSATLKSLKPEHFSSCILNTVNPTLKTGLLAKGDARVDNMLGELSIVIDRLKKHKTTFTEGRQILKAKDVIVPDTRDEIIL